MWCFGTVKAERSYESLVEPESRLAPSSTTIVPAAAVGAALLAVAAAIHALAAMFQAETAVELATAEPAVPSSCCM